MYKERSLSTIFHQRSSTIDCNSVVEILLIVSFYPSLSIRLNAFQIINCDQNLNTRQEKVISNRQKEKQKQPNFTSTLFKVWIRFRCIFVVLPHALLFHSLIGWVFYQSWPGNILPIHSSLFYSLYSFILFRFLYWLA